MDTADELAARVFERPRHPPAPAARLLEERAAGAGHERDGAAVPEDTGPDFAGPYQAFGRTQPIPLRCLVLYFNAQERRKYGRKKVQIRYEHLDSEDPAGEGFAADGG
jgi:hypothetical protein